MYKLLSHVLDPADFGYPGEPTLEIEFKTRISQGAAYNSAVLHLFNHFGTHFDAPKHFYDQGQAVAELPLERFVFDKPLLLDIPKDFGELLDINDLEPFSAEIDEADLLLIRTGIGEWRKREPQRYAAEGPAVSVDLARFMISKFKKLKALGLDTISLASPVHPDEGVPAHQIMLGMFSENYICIIEDMNLTGLKSDSLKRVIALPLMVRELDSGNVTVLAELR